MKVDKNELPYGLWFIEDGTMFIFNRNYQPMYKRNLDGTISKPPRTAWIEDIKSTMHFYEDGTPEKLVAHTKHFLDSFLKNHPIVEDTTEYKTYFSENT